MNHLKKLNYTCNYESYSMKQKPIHRDSVHSPHSSQCYWYTLALCSLFNSYWADNSINRNYKRTLF